MTNHYLKAIDILSENLPDTNYELDQYADRYDTGKRGDMGTPKEARAFAIGVIDDLIGRLKEIRDEVGAMPLKEF